MTRFERVCACIVVRHGWNAGQSVGQLAKLSGRSPATVRRWLRTTGVISLRRRA